MTPKLLRTQRLHAHNDWQRHVWLRIVVCSTEAASCLETRLLQVLLSRCRPSHLLVASLFALTGLLMSLTPASAQPASASRGVRAVSAQQPPARPDLYVLAVAVSDYRDARIPDLTYPDDDARGMLAWAETQSGHLYDTVYTRLLENEQATRAAIVHAMVDFFSRARPEDQLVLFIAGHGLIEQRTGRYHFFPVDTDTANIAGTALEQDDLIEKLETSERPHERVLILIDTCHGGKVAEALSGNTLRGGFLIGNVERLDDRRVAQKGSIWAVFSAGTASELAGEGAAERLSWEPVETKGHGFFTLSVLRALGSTAADVDHNGRVTLTEFQQYVEKSVLELSRGNQLPLISGKLSDVALSWAVGTEERCDGVDNNYDGKIDEGFPDRNENGRPDCLDAERCNGIDDNGDGKIDEGFDLDGDGHNAVALCGSSYGDDCDDRDISIHPNQKDWGNLRDDDCDGRVDEEDFDTNSNGIPDFMEKRHQQLSVGRWATVGAGAALTVAGLISYGTLSLIASDSTGQPNQLTPDQVERYTSFSRAAVVLGGSGATLLGVGIGLTVQGHRFRADFFPRATVTAQGGTP